MPWIIDIDGGDFQYQDHAPGTAGTPTGSRSAQMPRYLSPDGEEDWDWSAGQIVANPARTQALLIPRVKDKASDLKMRVLTRGSAKSKIYAAKQAEVVAFNSAGGLLQSVTSMLAAVAALSSAERQRKFRYAEMERHKRGEPTIQAAIARFSAGADTSDQEVARIETIEQDGIRLIKAAVTGEAKRAAFAAIDWNWSP